MMLHSKILYLEYVSINNNIDSVIGYKPLYLLKNEERIFIKKL